MAAITPPPQVRAGAPKPSTQKQVAPPVAPVPTLVSPPQRARAPVSVQLHPAVGGEDGGGGGGEPPNGDDSSSSSPTSPMLAKDEVKGVFSGMVMTFCGCFVFCGKSCSSFWKDTATCFRDSRRAFCCSAVAMYILCVMLLLLAFASMCGVSIWSSAYYKRHYYRDEKILRVNATKINATQAAKDEYKEWKDRPEWDYFPMQPRYWVTYMLGIISIAAAFIQTPGRVVRVSDDLLDDPHDDGERQHCLCQLNCFNRLTQVTLGVAYILDMSFSWGFFIMASTFIDEPEENRHLFVPVYSVMAQLLIMSVAVVCMLFGKWIAYKEAMRYTRGDMLDDDAVEKLN